MSRRRAGGAGAVFAGLILAVALLGAAAGGVYAAWLTVGPDLEAWFTPGLIGIAILGGVLGLVALANGRRWLAAVIAVFAVAAVIALLVPRLTAPPPPPPPPPPEALIRRSPMLLPEVQTWTQGVVPMCWVRMPDPVADAVLIRAVDRAKNAWRDAGYVLFQDVGRCPRGFEGVRLLISRDPSEDPDSAGVGAPQTGPNYDVVLKAAFRSRTGCLAQPGADLEGCIFAKALHEFGHVLGLPDVQYSAEAPEACRSRLAHYEALAIPYDGGSIMNACNDAAHLGKLSPGDMAAIRQTYGPFPAPVGAGVEFAR